MTRPSIIGGHHAEGGRVGHRVEGDGALGAALAVEGDQGRQIEVGEHVAVDHDEGLVDAGEGGGEPDGAGRVERLGLDGIGQPHAGDPAVRVGLQKGVGQVAERKDRILDAVGGEVAEHPLDHRHPDDREHLFGRRERQRPEPRPLAAHEDNRLHYLVVVVDEGFVVVVDEAGVDVVVVSGADVVVVADCTVLDVVPAAVVVVVATGADHRPGPAAGRVMVEAGGFGSCVPFGTNPIVISWRFKSLRSAGFVGRDAPGLLSSPFFAGLGRDDPRPRLHRRRPCRRQGCRPRTFRRCCTGTPSTTGSSSLVLVNVNPVYPSANFPRVALLPASLAFFGVMSENPAAGGGRGPSWPMDGEAGSAGCMVPQMSKASPACQEVPTAGWTAATSPSCCSCTWPRRWSRSR